MANPCVLMNATSPPASISTTAAGGPLPSGSIYYPNSAGYILADPEDIRALEGLSPAWVIQKINVNQGPAYNTNGATSNTTLGGNDITGGTDVYLAMTASITANRTATLPTVADTVPLRPVVQAGVPTYGTVSGSSYRFTLINPSANQWTVLTNTGWTLGGTMTVPAGTWREFLVNFIDRGTAKLQSLRSGTV